MPIRKTARRGAAWLPYMSKQDPRGLPLLESVLDGQDDELSDRVRTTLGKPQTLHRRVETPTAKVNEEARELAAKSLEKGFLKDALRYLRIVYETDPMTSTPYSSWLDQQHAEAGCRGGEVVSDGEAQSG